MIEWYMKLSEGWQIAIFVTSLPVIAWLLKLIILFFKKISGRRRLPPNIQFPDSDDDDPDIWTPLE